MNFDVSRRGGAPWTAAVVAERLVAGFRRVPGRPVLSSSRGFRIDGVEVEAFGWPERFVPDPRSRMALMTWARCLAEGESVREQYRAMGWARTSTERKRREALAAIAAGLNAATDPG